MSLKLSYKIMNLKIMFFFYSIITAALSSYFYTTQIALNEKLLTSQVELAKQIEVNKSQAEIISNLERKFNIFTTADSSIINCGFNLSDKIQDIPKIFIEQPSSSDVVNYVSILGAGVVLFLAMYYLPSNFSITGQIDPQLPAPITPETLNNKLDIIIERTVEINTRVTNIENIIVGNIGNVNHFPANNLLIENVQNLPNNAIVLPNGFDMQAAELIAGFANNLGNF